MNPLPDTPAVRIHLLGRFEVCRDGCVLGASGWQRQKAAALFARLALEGRLLKDQAIEGLWPEVLPESGANNLYQTLHLLRQNLDMVLGEGTAALTLSFERGVLRLGEQVWVDAHAFVALCSKPDAPAAALEQALALYQGELLPDERYAEWAVSWRARLEHVQRDASLRLAAGRKGNHDFETAISLLTPLLRRDPADEAVHQELMRLYALAGRRHEALRQYQLCVEALASELEVSPTPETEALYTQVLEGDISPPAGPEPVQRPPAPVQAEAQRSGPLVGREDELDMICSRIQAMQGGRGCALLLGGEAGVGKTRLSLEALDWAGQTGMTTLMGSAYEQEGRLPYQPFIEAFDRYLAKAGRPANDNPISHYQPLGSPDPQQEHSALFHKTASFLADLTRAAPVVLLLDDLHAADEASLSLCHFLARQTQSLPLTLLAIYRIGEVSAAVSPFGSLLNALYREGLGDSLRLAALAEHATAEVMAQTLGGPVTPELAHTVYGIVEGNPFYTQEVTHALVKAGQLEQQDGSWHMQPGGALRLPHGLQRVLRERVARLGLSVEPVLRTAAVIGRSFGFELLRKLAAFPDDVLLDALDAALAGHLLEETEDGYRFRHALIRQSLYDAPSQARRAYLHRRTAEAMERVHANRPKERGPQSEALAYHFERSDQPERALPYLLQAGQKAAGIYALELAADHFERALALMDEFGLTDNSQRWTVLEALGYWKLILADMPRAVAYLEAALALPVGQGGQPTTDDRLRAHNLASRALMTAGDMLGAERHLNAAREQLEAQTSADGADLLYTLAQWHWHQGQYHEAQAAAERSLQIAEQLEDHGRIALAFEMLALAFHALGEWRRGLDVEARRAALVGGEQDVLYFFDIHLCLWEYQLYGDKDYGEVRRTADALIAQARRMGAPRAAALGQCFKGALEFYSGAWDDAERILREAIILDRQIGAASGEALAAQRLGVLLTARGRLDEALRVLEEGALAAERAILRTHCLTRVYAALMRNRLAAGDLAAAGQALALGLAASEQHGHCHTCSSLLLPAAVSVSLAQGELEAAAAFCRQLDEAAARYGSRMWLAMAQQARGELEAARGEPEAALAACDRAHEGFRASGHAYEAARSLTLAADIRLNRQAPGDADTAKALQTEARRLFEQLGVA